MKNRGLLRSIAVALFVLTFLVSAAFAVPQTINYQGELADSGGTPVDGTVSMTFSIYDVSTEGSSLWSETQGSVAVTDGSFSVALGSVTPINLAFDVQYYLGVKVGADEEMTPRATLVSVPYAMRAGTADTADTAVTLGDKTLSQLVALLDERYGDLGDSLVADFSATPLEIMVDNPVDFTDLTQGVTVSWNWDFGDTGTSTLQDPSHTYTSGGAYTVSLTSGDGVTSNTATKVDYITVASPGTITTVDSEGNVGMELSMAIGADGLPVVSYLDSTNYDLKVLHCGDASCSSGNTVTTADSVGDAGYYTSIAIGADGLPVVSYLDSTNTALKVLHCGDASCSSGNTITTVDSAGSVGQDTSIAIGADGLPVVAYHDSTNGDLKVAHCGDASCSSGNTISTVDEAGLVGMNISIAIGADDLPVVSYIDLTNTALKVLHCGDASCSSGNTITTVDSAGDVGYYTSIAIGTDGRPVVSYFDFTNYDLKVLRCGNASCSSGNNITTVDSSEDVGRYTSIAIGTDGLPMVSYYDDTNTALKVAHCVNASCLSGGDTLTTVDSAGTVGPYASIAIGADGLPVVAYYDQTNTNLKVLHCGNADCTLW